MAGCPAPRAGGGGGALRSALDAVLADTGENDSEMPPELLCPITLTLMADPVTTVDGMTYERYAIETWLQANNTSPLTGEPLPVKLLVPNTALRSQIQRYWACARVAGRQPTRWAARAPGRAPRAQRRRARVLAIFVCSMPSADRRRTSCTIPL